MKFTGDFKKLKNLGFKRMKLYADNRIVYNLKNIWVHKRYGGYIEISDFKDYTQDVYEKIIKIDFKKINIEHEIFGYKFITIFIKKQKETSNVLVFKGICTRRFKTYHAGLFLSESEVNNYIETIKLIQAR